LPSDRPIRAQRRPCPRHRARDHRRPVVAVSGPRFLKSESHRPPRSFARRPPGLRAARCPPPRHDGSDPPRQRVGHPTWQHELARTPPIRRRSSSAGAALAERTSVQSGRRLADQATIRSGRQ
jgi:hypothetical protein